MECHISSESLFIDTTKSEFSSNGCFSIFGEPERELSLGNEFLVDEVVPQWGSVVHRDGIKSQPANSVKLCLEERESEKKKKK